MEISLQKVFWTKIQKQPQSVRHRICWNWDLYLCSSIVTLQACKPLDQAIESPELKKGGHVKTLGCTVILILAMAIPNFCFGADMDKQGVGAAKESIEQLMKQKKKEFEEFKQRLMNSNKKELQQLKEKLESQIPQDRQKITRELEQKKAALQKQTKQELEKKRDELKSELKSMMEEMKREFQGKKK